MGDPATSGWGGPRAPRLRGATQLRRDEEAAAGVVTIMLGILTIILVMTMVTTVWMPNWMKDKEADHMRAVTDDFDQLKSNIDAIVLMQDPAFLVGSPIVLGTEGYPMFETDSAGTFSINYFRDDVAEFSFNVRNATGQLNVTATGGMKYASNHRYYSDQLLSYENGAIIAAQGEGQVLRVGPQFSVEDLGATTKVSFVLITVLGVETSITGVGPIMVDSQLVTYTSEDYMLNTPEWLTLTIVTEYPKAWARYYNGTFTHAGLTPVVDYTTTVGTSKVTIGINNTNFINIGYALLKVDIESTTSELGGGIPMPGAVAIWHMGEESGATAHDATANGNDMTLVGAGWTSHGAQGSALQFDNTSYAKMAPTPSLTLTTGVSVEAWFKWTVDPATGSSWACIYCQGEQEFELMHSGPAKPLTPNNGAFEFALRTDVERRFAWSDVVPVSGKWYHVVGTWSAASEELRLYVNGALENSTHINGSLINDAARDFVIGGRHNGGAVYDRLFEGVIDEVNVYDRALTATEVAMRYIATKPYGA